jgi:hypothetical protein
MHKTKAGSSNILYSNSCVLEAEQRNETKRYATHKHTHAHTATATATERERKRHHCMLYAICAIADYRRRESKRHLFVVDSLDKHMQNEKELIRLRRFMPAARTARARSAQFRLRCELPSTLHPRWFNFACGAKYPHQRKAEDKVRKSRRLSHRLRSRSMAKALLRRQLFRTLSSALRIWWILRSITFDGTQS